MLFFARCSSLYSLLILNNLSLFGANKSSVTNNFRFISFFFMLFIRPPPLPLPSLLFHPLSSIYRLSLFFLCVFVCVCMFFFNSLSSHGCLLRRVCVLRGELNLVTWRSMESGSPKPNITWKREGPTANHPAGKLFVQCTPLSTPLFLPHTLIHPW